MNPIKLYFLELYDGAIQFIDKNLVDICLLLLTLIIVVFMAYGCASKPVKFVERTDTVKVRTVEYKVRDSIIWAAADSSESMWLIDCEGENARLRQILAYRPGERIKPPNISIVGNKLTVICKEDSLRQLIRIKDKTITDLTSTTRQVILPPEKYVPALYKWTLKIVLIELFLLIVFILYKVFKSRIPFKI